MKSVKEQTVLFFDTVNSGVRVCVISGKTKHEEFIELEGIDKKKKDKIINSVVKTAMAKANVNFANIDYFAVVVGPGSWTGARVGVAVAKAYAMVWKKPIVALKATDSLEEIEKKIESGETVTYDEIEPLYDKEFVVTLR